MPTSVLISAGHVRPYVKWIRYPRKNTGLKILLDRNPCFFPREIVWVVVIATMIKQSRPILITHHRFLSRGYISRLFKKNTVNVSHSWSTHRLFAPLIFNLHTFKSFTVTYQVPIVAQGGVDDIQLSTPKRVARIQIRRFRENLLNSFLHVTIPLIPTWTAQPALAFS